MPSQQSRLAMTGLRSEFVKHQAQARAELASGQHVGRAHRSWLKMVEVTQEAIDKIDAFLARPDDQKPTD